MKNMMDFCIGVPCYWLIGFGIMFADSGALIGGFDPLIRGSYDFGTLPVWCYAIFQTVFCATAATIVSGSMAERTNFKAYCIYSAVISLIIYPISGHWIWGGGWLSSLNFHDFAGSTCVHMVGGLIACLGAAMLGPRIGKYDKNGKVRAIPGHNMTAMALGVFILWFCWFGFNGGSTVAMSTDEDMTLASLVMFNTNLAAAVATVVAMIFTWIRYGKPDVSMTFNAALAGLVAITTGCDCVTPVGAFFIGLVSGLLVVLSVEFFDKIAKIDDPVGAVSVHMVNGIWGTLAVGLFSNGGDGVAPGLFYGGGFTQLGVQALGVISVAAYVLIAMFIIFKIIDKTVGLRVPSNVEIDGLDIHEHGLASAYSGFAISDITSLDMEVNENTDLGEYDYEKASPAQVSAAVKVTEKKTIVDGVYDTGMHKVRCNKIFSLCFVFAIISAMIMGWIFILGRSFFVSIFTRDSGVVEYAYTRMIIVLSLYFILCTYEVGGSVLRGLGYSMTPAVLTVFGTCIFRLFWVWVICDIWPSYDVLLLVYPISWIITGTAVLSVYFILRGNAYKRFMKKA